jgi:autotransporter-associated beta strand protein
MSALVLDSSQTWTNNSSNPLNVTAALSGTGALTLAGSGTVALPGGANIGDLTVNSGTLDLHGANATISAVSGGANGTITTYTGSATLIVAGSDNGVYQGKLVDGGAGQALAVLESGSGILNLSGSNTYSGGTTVSSGTLAIIADSGLGAVSGGLAIGPATLEVAGNIASVRNITLDDPAATIQVDPSITYSESGTLSGTGGLTLTGGGTLILSGTDNTYSDGTLVSSGTLVLANQGAIETGTSLIVGEGAAQDFGLVVPSVMRAGNEQAVPEPGTLALCGAVLCAAAVYRSIRSRRRRI